MVYYPNARSKIQNPKSGFFTWISTFIKYIWIAIIAVVYLINICASHILNIQFCSPALLLCLLFLIQAHFYDITAIIMSNDWIIDLVCNIMYLMFRVLKYLRIVEGPMLKINNGKHWENIVISSWLPRLHYNLHTCSIFKKCVFSQNLYWFELQLDLRLASCFKELKTLKWSLLFARFSILAV